MKLTAYQLPARYLAHQPWRGERDTPTLRGPENSSEQTPSFPHSQNPYPSSSSLIELESRLANAQLRLSGLQEAPEPSVETLGLSEGSTQPDRGVFLTGVDVEAASQGRSSTTRAILRHIREKEHSPLSLSHDRSVSGSEVIILPRYSRKMEYLPRSILDQHSPGRRTVLDKQRLQNLQADGFLDSSDLIISQNEDRLQNPRASEFLRRAYGNPRSYAHASSYSHSSGMREPQRSPSLLKPRRPLTPSTRDKLFIREATLAQPDTHYKSPPVNDESRSKTFEELLHYTPSSRVEYSIFNVYRWRPVWFDVPGWGSFHTLPVLAPLRPSEDLNEEAS
ncbi:hypothetical protein GMRT_11022 [Giardia muris]|uniref:Uncharacterized protein n=1 Tax=Giardia muris TaxID=5742 RepID=A0A4Z1T3S3_GIAMU|nr:hypothetical protein GMRT_11022 [Giardia muris]|eukprot:TNJ27189.1 hypothetical protein GMRT_11022 [Giardia muris]